MEARNSKKQKQEIGNESEGSLHPLANNHHAIIGNLRSLREGSHYTLKIESFSLFRNITIDNHESRAFEAGGYKWKLSLYPNGNKKRNVNDHISFYLAIAETESLPLGWEVNVDFKLYVFDHIRDKYSTIQDGEGSIRRFHRMKTEWGFDKFIPLETFNHASNGYLLEDCCVFGAEVFLMKSNGKGECVMTMKNPLSNTYTWKIDEVSKIDAEEVLSEAFVVGEHKWKLVIYPKGNGTAKNKSLSVFLELADWETLPPEWKVYAEYKMRIRDQFQIIGTNMQKKAKELTVQNWFCASSKSYGYPDFMALSDLNKASEGFLVNDAMIVEIDFAGADDVTHLRFPMVDLLYVLKSFYDPVLDLLITSENLICLMFTISDTEHFSQWNLPSTLVVDISGHEATAGKKKNNDQEEKSFREEILNLHVFHARTMRSLRDVPPAHYTLKLTSFSIFRDTKIGNYESGVFEAGGYKWKLCIYPNGNVKMNVKGHLSCYLAIADTETLPPGWEVNVSFKLFVFDQVRDKYLTIQDAEGGVGQFHRMKTECGFDQFLPLGTFNDASNGYLVDDCCVFGAEVFVIKYTGKGESASMVKNLARNIYTWRIDSFSATDQDKLISEEFVVGGHKWKLDIYPKGNSLSSKGKSVSLFLRLADCKNLPLHRKMYAEFKLRMRDQVRGNHIERKVGQWFCESSAESWGYADFMPLSELNDASKGFMVNGVAIVEAEITLISSFKDF
ncbi:hypothetical protein C3L33_21023, partial [Rhododendron williamsianum]